MTDVDRYARAKSGLPPIEVDQRWVGYGADGSIFRRLRVLARHPDGGWIVCDDPAPGQKHRPSYVGSMTVCSEFNLRYVFVLERKET